MAERRRRGERAEEGRQTGATSDGGRPGDEVVDDDVVADSAVTDEDVATEDDVDDEFVDEDSEDDADEVDDPDAIADDDEADDDEADGGRRSRRGADRDGGRATATKTRPKSTAPAGRKTDKDRPAKKTDERPGIFARFVNFVREVVAELRKVIWPTRSELLRYTTVVVVFVTIMVSIVGLLDYGFAKGVLWIFGSKTK